MFGFLNRNRYIVELYHKNPKKIIPLYISTNDRNVRQKWEYYARTLNLPAMVETDEGLVIREIDDLGKSVREMAEKWNIKEKFDPKAPVPGSLIVKNKDRKTIIKIRNRLWDAYSLMALFFLTAGAALAGARICRHPQLGNRRNRAEQRLCRRRAADCGGLSNVVPARKTGHQKIQDCQRSQIYELFPQKRRNCQDRH